MNPFHVFARDFRYFIKQPMLIVTFIAVAFIPILYSGFLIKGAWDPYGKLKELPVAVVNLDQGANFQGKYMTVGNEFVDELKKNRSFDWRFVSDQEARQGMKKNHYYATITIPAGFSADAASLTSNNPKQAEIIYESNSYYNFVAGQISENATKELRNKLSKNLTEAYSRSIFSQFETISSGFQTAAEGAVKLNEGASQLNAGMTKLKTSTAQLASGADKLGSGAQQLQTGAVKLRNGASQVSTGAADLASGAGQLAAAGTKLQQGAAKTVEGSSAFISGIKASKVGADQLTAGIESSASGSKQLAAGLSASADASKELSDGSEQVAASLKQLMSANSDLAGNADLQKILAASETVAHGAKALHTGQNQLLSGSQTLDQGQQKLLSGSKQLSSVQQQLLQGAISLQEGQQQLNSGLKQFNSKFTSLVSGSSKLQQGAGALGQGADQLVSGLGTLVDGISKVASGAKQLDSGAAQLSVGAVKLVDGSSELATKLKEAAKKTSDIKADDKMIQMLAQPVAIKANDDRKVTLYANGIAPYFLSMSLFAGGLIFTTMFSARSTTVEGATGIGLFISKMLIFGIMSLIQSLIVSTAIVFILGLKVQSIPLFYLYTTLVGFTFMFVIQAFVTWLDQPGRFVVLLLMIFQLASSAGTFPLELLPNWAKAMNPWLPMTYSIRGYRDVISSGDYTNMWHQLTYLVIYIVIFVILTFTYFLIRRKGTTDEQLMPVKI
ncbi:phage infection protein [Paenibacillus baekrokdamisoli]|uniref:Phage infection protein n=1 Tax=Paenibacillus baekrokdamisoli TaxID=1712516 RepID=A0A3G9JDD6_9BACL|nr:YhgE/Pip domain-containing protein [Paenibacillus baekrokdamisoli]MBB3072922.1 putative membrane protein [Paenibacillus baekrokdamisoli]BBH21998.1 phage infection protein [Paenibacillus baekrokdamisoli]